MPPSHRPPVSPPTMTSVPFGVRARRRRDSDALPADVEDQVVALLALSAKSSRV